MTLKSMTPDLRPFMLIIRKVKEWSLQAEFDVAANDQGRVDLIIGTDSGSEGTTSWYLDDISVG